MSDREIGASLGDVGTSRSLRFRREHEAEWGALEALVALAEREGAHALHAVDLLRLPSLYRSALSSLAVARSISLDRNALDYLESLVDRAYLCVYGTRRRAGEAVRTFVGQRFPRVVRSFGWPIALAALVTILGTAVSFVLTARDEGRFHGFIEAAMAQGRGPESSTTELREILYGGKQDQSALLDAFATYLFTHNAKIGMEAFSFGVLAGLPVFWLLFTNGLNIGALAGLYQHRGLGLEFWAWTLPHGVTELGAVVLCGGAGFGLAQALLFPGPFGRLESVGRRGRDAAVVVLGCVGCFFLAACIEGFFRQLVHSVAIRYAVAAASALAWSAYFIWAGRGELRPKASERGERALASEAGAVGQLTVYAPEGLPLGFRLAEIGDRANAFLLDLFWVALLIALFVLSAMAVFGVGFTTLFGGGQAEAGLLLSFLILGLFLVWNFYFTFFELLWQGQTPGKRRFGLRAIDTRGGALSVEAIFARNLTRDFEIVLPAACLLSPHALLPNSPLWAQGLAALWLLALLFFPAFNARRLRVGDLVAGTVVVALPKRVLLRDLQIAVAPTLTFTPAQLDVYGIFELQKLEDVLREVGRPHGDSALAVVAQTIRSKLEWPEGDAVDDETFLTAFYSALRLRLEQRLALGERRERKR